MKAPVRVRFAPAPTGTLHVGGARTALFNYLYARQHGGTLILRSEDTDMTRSSAESETVIQADLHWLGLTWDEGTDVGGPYGPYRQSDRFDRYGLAAARLIEIEAAYPCYCTPEELEAEREAAEKAGVAPKYSGKCLALTREQRGELEAAGRKPALRFKMPQRDVYVEDLIHGAVHFPAAAFGDFVIMKSDGSPAYNFAAVVDDGEMRVTHVIRGDEHLPNTPRQAALFEALEWPLPLFAHVSMILAPDHQKLSKRHGATSVAEYREQGYLAPALANYLALLGWSPGDDREVFSLEELVRAFSLDRVSRSPAVFDQPKLRWFNAHYVRSLGRDERAAIFAEWARKDEMLATAPELDDPAWRTLLVDATSDHVEVLSDVPRELHELLRQEQPERSLLADALADGKTREMLAELQAIAARAPDREAFAAAATAAALAQLGAKFQLKGRALYRPIRIAVSGKEHGIELPLLLPLLGPARVAERIEAALALAPT